MNTESFNRIKKMVRREGKVVFFDDEEAYVLMPLSDYEELTEDLCGEECECSSTVMSSLPNGGLNAAGDEKLDEEIFFGDPESGRGEEERNEEVDKELIRKVNEDIAKWREEQTNQEINKTPLHQGFAGQAKNQEVKIEENLVDLSEVAGEPASTCAERGEPEKKEDTLTEEERYYLEPLE